MGRSRTLFIRDKDNRTIVDTECSVKTPDEIQYKDNKYVEVESVVDIERYSKFLLENLDRKDEIINDFSNLQELRGWLWEVYFMGEQNNPDKYNEVIEILRKDFRSIAIKYNLHYIED